VLFASQPENEQLASDVQELRVMGGAA